MTESNHNSAKKSDTATKKKHEIALLGSPNCGKTTLFNRLTGSRQTTGNWPGVTVEQKSGYFKQNGQDYHLIDLPGIYSLEVSNLSGQDEEIARHYLQEQTADLIINVVDATSLERQLFLTAQLLHMGLPMVVVLNRMDLLKERGICLDVEKLSEHLGCPVIPVSAYHNKGIEEFKKQIPNYLNKHVDLHFDLPEVLHNSVHKIRNLQNLERRVLVDESCWKTMQVLIHPETAVPKLQTSCYAEKKQLEEHYQEDLALIAADLYFQFAHDGTHECQINSEQFSQSTTEKVDKWALHPIWGLPIFFAVMYFLFATSIAMGNVFIDFFDLGAQAIFVDGTANILNNMGSPEWFTALIANGVGGGIQVVATFIPVIGALYLLLSILEDTGYMQRAALVLDNFMRRIGLSGQAFVPLVIGFGCNIPGVMASRSLPNHADRIKTIMMTPFMSCSARLTVYVMFATAFFEDNAALLVFSLYFIGILAAVLTAWMLKKTLVTTESPPMLMELPIYHKPTVMNVAIHTRNRLRGFIMDAGKVIIGVVLVLNVLNSLGTNGSFGHENQESSVLSSIAKAGTPIVEPLGITEENWPATVGLFTGILAKEVVVGSLDALYQQREVSTDSEEYDFIGALGEALQTIPDNLQGMLGDISDPLGLHSIETVTDKELIAEEQGFELSTLDKMVQQFDGQIGAYAYLLLILLYFPCVATFGAIKQELGWRWALASGGWSLFLGYAVAVSFYQIATYQAHPLATSIWVSVFAAIFIAIWFGLKWTAQQQSKKVKKVVKNYHDLTGH